METLQSRATTVDAYLRALPDDRRRILRRIRALARNAFKGFEERIEHGMPCYRRAPGEGFAFASQKQYVALYLGEDVVAAFRSRLTEADLGKACVRFRDPERIDLRLVEEMLHTCARRRSIAS